MNVIKDFRMRRVTLDYRGDSIEAISSGLAQGGQKGVKAVTRGDRRDAVTNSRSPGRLPKAARVRERILLPSLQKNMLWPDLGLMTVRQCTLVV